MSNQERQTAYRQVIQALIECPQDDEQGIFLSSQSDQEILLTSGIDYLNEGFIETLKDEAKMMMQRNNPELHATIHRLLNLARQLERKLRLAQSKFEDYYRFCVKLLQIVDESKGDEMIVHQFFDEHLSYFNLKLSVATFPGFIGKTGKLLQQRVNPALQDNVKSIVEHLAIALKTYPRGNRSIFDQLAIACQEQLSLVHNIDHEESEDFFLDLLQAVADSQGDGAIVHQFLDEHLAYLNEQLLAAIPQSVAALLEQTEDRDRQTYIRSIVHNLSIDLQAYPRGNHSINLQLAIACQDQLSLVHSQPDEQIDSLQERLCQGIESEIDRSIDEDRQNLYFQLVQALLECPNNEEDRVLDIHPDLVDEGLVIALLEEAEIRKEHNNPDLAWTIEWLESFAAQLSQKLELQQEASQQTDDEESENFFLYLLQVVADSQGDGAIVHQFLDEHLDYLNEQLLAAIPQSIEALLEREQDPDRQADIRSIVHNLSADLQTYPHGDRSINLALSIACQEQSSLVHHQLDEQIDSTQEMLCQREETEIVQPDKDVYLDLALALLECPLHDEDRVLAAHPELVDRELVITLLAMAKFRREDNHPDSASIVERLEAFAEQLSQKLGLQLDTSEQNEDEESQNFFPYLLQAVADSQGDGAIVHQFLNEYLDYLNEYLLACLPQQAKLLLEREEDPDRKSWIASLLHSLAVYLFQFTRGNRSINLELSIACYEAALLEYTRERFPLNWAMTQMNRALAYSDPIEEDKRKNLEKAIQGYDLALLEYTRERFPLEWAMTQMNRAIVYQNRIEGDKWNNLDEAIRGYDSALLEFTREKFPLNWGRIQINLALAYSDSIKGDEPKNSEKVIRCYDLALLEYTREQFPLDWAMIHLNRADAYRDRIEGDEWDNLGEAIQGYDLALLEYTHEKFPLKNEIINDYRKMAYMRLVKEPLLEYTCKKFSLDIEIINDYRKKSYIILVHDLLGCPLDDRDRVLAASPHLLDKGLVVTLLEMASYLGNEDNNPDSASKIECLESFARQLSKKLGLEDEIKSEIFFHDLFRMAATFGMFGGEMVYEFFDKHLVDLNKHLLTIIPQQAKLLFEKGRSKSIVAATLGNLASDLCEFPRGNQSINIELSIAYNDAVLLEWTYEKFPLKWATTQMNRASSYLARIAGDKQENIEEAIFGYFRASLEYTRKEFPLEWAMIQMNLAAAYQDRIKGVRGENLEEAIESCDLALLEYTRQNSPLEWAKTHMNRAHAYKERIEGVKGENIEEAIRSCDLALLEYTRQNSPLEWAKTHMNQACAYRERIEGDKRKNLEKAIQGYDFALLEFTPERFPLGWARIQMNLAGAYQERIEGDKRENLKESIWSHNLALTIFTPASQPIDALAASRSLGLTYFEQGEWQLAINAYEIAMESVETSRSWVLDEQRRKKLLENALSVYQNAIQCAINLQNYPQAIQYTERIRSRQLVELMGTKDLSADAEVSPQTRTYLDEYADLDRQIQNLRQQPYSLSNTLAIITLEHKKNATYLNLRSLDPVLAGQMQVSAIEFTDIQKLIPNNHTAILTCYSTKDDTHIFIIKQGQSPTLHTCKGQGYNFHEWLQADWIVPDRKDLPRLLREISQRLELDTLITRHLTDIKELIIVPHLNLHRIPFAALPIRGTEKLLGERFIIRSIPSCQILQYCKNRQDRLPITTAIIGTVEDADDTLLGARYEGAQITALYNIPPTNRLIGSTQATAANYRDLLARVNRIHSSHHAIYRRDNPLESALILAQGETITLGDLLLGKRYPNLDEVFLAACETHVGKTTLTDDLATLTTGFLCIGARSVQSTLWSVDDLATVIFNLFYHQQRKIGVTPAIAIQTAQRQLRDLTGKQFKSYHPAIVKYVDDEINSFKDRCAELTTQQSNLDRNTQTEKWEELTNQIDNLTGKIKSLQGILSQSKRYCKVDRPFKDPFYWAGFITQGMG